MLARLLTIAILFPQLLSAQLVAKDFKITVDLSSAGTTDKFYIDYNYRDKLVDKKMTDSADNNSDKIIFKGKIAEPGMAAIYRFKKFELPAGLDTAAYFKRVIPTDADSETIAYVKDQLVKPRKEAFEFFLEPGETKIKIYKQLDFSQVDGPPGTMDLVKLKNSENKFFMRQTASTMKLMLAQQNKDSVAMEKAMIEFEALENEIKEKVYLDYFKKNLLSSLAAYTLIYSAPMEIDTADKYLAFIHLLAPNVQSWPSIVKFKTKLEIMKKTEPGTMVADFVQQDTLGKPVKFSSFKGRYVLVDLWASWCGPCRRMNPGFVKVFDKYKGENFTILGVALEEKGDKDKWLQAIRKDHLAWQQVTDFKDWKNAVALQFGIESIPFNVLVDPEGKIIAKHLKPDQLEEQLAKIFKR